MSRKQHVRLLSGALDEYGNKLIVRGVIDHKTLGSVLVDDYQREALGGASQEGLIAAFQGDGPPPDVELGMRGDDLGEDDGGVYELLKDTYIVDGFQRLTAALLLMERDPEVKPRLGATVHLNTTQRWERQRFLTLNAGQIKVSPNVMARNERHESPVLTQVWSMTKNDRGFVLKDRVCWQQRMKTNELLSVMSLLKIIGVLHGHRGPGRSNKLRELNRGLAVIFGDVGQKAFRENVRTFFSLVDEIWGIRHATYRDTTHLRLGFLLSLATILSDNNQLFFKGNALTVDAATIRKLRSFPIRDPQVQTLASTGNSGVGMLAILMVNHINAHRRTRRLTLIRGEGNGDEETT